MIKTKTNGTDANDASSTTPVTLLPREEVAAEYQRAITAPASKPKRILDNLDACRRVRRIMRDLSEHDRDVVTAWFVAEYVTESPQHFDANS